MASATAGLIALAIAAKLLIVVYDEYQVRVKDYAGYQSDRDQHHEKSANEIIAKCDIRDGPVLLPKECLKEEIGAFVKKDSTNKDLEAQQEMAYWAMMTFIVGSLGLFVSIGGLVGLFLSLNQTRRSISNAREIGNAQVRAYLAVEFADMIGNIGMPYSFKIINTGQSPARNVKYVASQIIVEYPLTPDQEQFVQVIIDERASSQNIPSQQFILGDAKIERPITADEMKLIQSNGSKRICLIIRVFYNDVFGEPRETDVCAYSFASIHREGGRTLAKIEWILADILNDAT